MNTNPTDLAPCCGKRWDEHLGIVGTCQELQDIMKHLQHSCDPMNGNKPQWCGDCGSPMTAVRPGKAQCDNCEIIQHLTEVLEKAQKRIEELTRKLGYRQGIAHAPAGKLWCAYCGEYGDHQSGWCPKIHPMTTYSGQSTSNSTSGDNIKDPTTKSVPQEKGEGEGV